MPTTREMSMIIRGAQAVQQVRRAMRFEANLPSLAASPQAQIHDQLGDAEVVQIDAGRSSIAQRSISSQLSSAITLSGMNLNPSSASIQPRVSGSSAFVGLDSVAPAVSAPSADALGREQAFVPYGDRVIGRTNTAPDTETQKFDSSETYPAPSVIDTENYQVTQSDLGILRDAIGSFAKRQTLFNPTISESDLQDTVDAVFGDGVSDLFHIRQVDLGAGKTEIRVNQLNVKDIVSSDEKDLVISAFSYASVSFKQGEHNPVYAGADIDAAVAGIRDTLGINAEPLVSQLEKSLKSGEKVQESFQAIADFMTDLQVSDATQSQVKSLLGNIASVAQTAGQSFAKKPFFDEFAIRYESGRYAMNRNSDDIADTAVLTENSVFLTK